MKRVFYTTIITLVLILSLLTLASCGGGACKHTDIGEDGVCTECGEQINAPKPPAQDGEIVLVEGGVPKFHIVTAVSSPDVIIEIEEFITKLNGYLNGEVVKVADTAATAQDVEIIIGSVKNRGDAYDIDEHYLGHNGYAVKAIDGKIVLYAGDVSGYTKALSWLEKEIFGISKSTNKLTEVRVDTGNAELFVEKTTSYPISVTIDGTPLNSYVLSYDTGNEELRKLMNEVQDVYYKSFGAWCDTVRPINLEESDRAIIVTVVENDYTSDGFLAYVDSDGDLVIECMFPDKMVEGVRDVLIKDIAGTTRNLNIAQGELESKDHRNVYYKDFGAKGDGITDDFEALRACHNCANTWGHTVNSDGKNAVYYIGKGNTWKTITVKTDTYWHGCKFIFDDHEIVLGDSERNQPIFHINSDSKAIVYEEDEIPIRSIAAGAQNVGWAPGYKAMLYVMNANVRHYLRYGANANSGAAQQEIIIVDADGNVDPSTPVQWTYDVVTSLTVYKVDDRPITISGADDGDRAIIETIFNGATSEYNYYWRNIYITRSNVLINNVKHVITNQVPQLDANGNIKGQGSPYRGFTFVQYSNNVTIDNFEFYKGEVYRVVENGQITSNNMGSYEINANNSNNVTWKNCVQSDFFNANGSSHSRGPMGTNYCKNLTFDNVRITVFDAHEGVYNATIKNSVCTRINLIGKGVATITNTDIYVDGYDRHSVFNLRDDYGSTWDGDINIDGLTIKYWKDSNYKISLIYSGYFDHNFGYTTYMPRNITLKNVRTMAYDFGLDEYGSRWETEHEVNAKEMTIFGTGIAGTFDINDGIDVTTPVVTEGNDPSCQHPHIDGDNRCVACNAKMRINIYQPTETITVINEDPNNPLLVRWMSSASFKNTEIIVDGVKIK